jgi:excisionase family DNA binding protein
VEVAVPVSFALPPEFVEAVAQRAADLLADRMSPPVEPWIGVDEAAEHLACPVSRIYRLVSLAKGRQANPVPYCKDGQRLLFRRSELDAWAGRGGGPGR